MRLPESLGPSAPGQPNGAPLRFAVLAEIASGDTARIDLCRVLDPEPMRNRLVATKRLHPHLLADAELASMFFDEVWMAASLFHPNVVEVAGWGEDAEGPYLAVELVEGVSLARLLKTVFDTGEIFGERMVVYVGSQICRGLAVAHELCAPDGDPLGLVHRDLTPGNVLVGFEGRVKITDFGLAKAKQRITRTVTGLLKGRPQYMAPEQARGDAVDARADLFSLGVLLFELFAGRRPWAGQTEFEVLATTQNDPPADLLELRPKIDRELAALVMRLLEKSPDDRFQSATEVGIRLDEWLALHGWSEGNDEALARFVRRNAMRQMRWFERAIKGELPAPRRKARGGSIPSMPEVAPMPSRRERSKRVSDDATEVSGAAAQASSRHAHHLGEEPPRRSPLELVDATPIPSGREDGGGFHEEIPTLVQRDRHLTPSLPVAASVRPPAHDAEPPLPGFEILEEDSDQRTTSVKRHNPSPALPNLGSNDGIEDPETETMPIKGPRQRAVRDAVAAARAAAPPAAAPHGVARTGPPPRPPRNRPPLPPPPALRPSAPPSAVAPPPAASPSLPAVAGPEGLDPTAAALVALAHAAEEEARHAAEAATKAAIAARRLAEAADAGQRALHAARTGGDVMGAMHAMEEARQLAEAVQRGDLDAPPLSMPRSSAPSEPAPGFGPPVNAELSAPPLSPPSSIAPPPPSIDGRHSFVSLPPELGLRPEGVAPSFPPPPSLPRGAGVFEVDRGGLLRERHPNTAGLDSPTAMALRFRPQILGLPPVVAAAIAVLGLLAMLLLVLVVTD